MRTRERLERKQERREEWATGREHKAAQAFKRADMSESATGIPFGQPILIGHHSEGAHRNAIKRAENAMNSACESSNMAEHHHEKAAGIQRQLDRSIFSDDENAIQAIQERIDGREKQRAFNNSVNKIIRRKPKNESTPEKVEELEKLGVDAAAAHILFTPDYGRIGIPSYVNANLSGNISSDKKRIISIKARNARQEAAEESGGVSITDNCGWCVVTFAEKPDYSIIKELKAAGFRWSRGSWKGTRKDLPETVKELAA